MARAPNLTVGFILAPRFTLCAFANFVDVLRLAADEGDRSRPIHCRWEVLSATGASVRSSCGVSVAPSARLGDPLAFDYIVVVGGLIGEIARLDPAYVGFLQHASDANVTLVGVCTGAFVLHAAGLMNGYKCCVSWFHRDDFLEEFDGLAPVSDQIFVVDRDRITCSGGVSSAHLAAHIVGRHVGTAAARKSLNIMIIDEALGADRPQPQAGPTLPTEDLVVRKAIAAMAGAIPRGLSMARLAASLGLSQRQMERRFGAALGLSPSATARLIRVSRARDLLKTTDLSVTDIAAATGFSDVSHLIRVFRAAEGQTPEAFRRAGVKAVR